jgi:hypothetical protein
MARLYLKRTLTGFVPADDASAEACKKYKAGEVYRADIVKPRSYQHHKLCMALLNLTFENQDRYDSFEVFRKVVARAAGHVTEYPDLNGEMVVEADSLSYERLDEVEFTKVMAAMMTVCCHILHDMDAGELEAQVSIYADQHYGAAA